MVYLFLVTQFLFLGGFLDPLLLLLLPDNQGYLLAEFPDYSSEQRQHRAHIQRNQDGLQEPFSI